MTQVRRTAGLQEIAIHSSASPGSGCTVPMNPDPGLADFKGKELIFMPRSGPSTPLISLARSLDLSNSRVINFPSKIFLCGGLIPMLHEQQEGLYCSLRHYIMAVIKKDFPDIYNKIILAENITDWYRGGHYEDLLTFESDLAGLAFIIIIIVESYGSIAELASFARDRKVNKKLLIIMNSCFYETESFIHLGPITYLETHVHNKANVFTWRTYVDNGNEYLDMESLQRHQIQDILKTINERLGMVSVEQTIDICNSGHVILMICDIIDILRIARKSEITYILENNHIDIQYINKYLFILEKLKLIKKIAYSTDRFYVSCSESAFIKYSYKKEGYAKDRITWKMIFMKWYQQNDERRMSALRTL